MTARLHFVDPKKFPKLEAIAGTQKKPKRQTQEQMISIVKAMNAAMGGRVIH